MYKLIAKPSEGFQNVIRLSDSVSIPFAEENSDYQAYLQWLSEGNVPTPADEVNGG